jgi:hypothetical protein
MKTSSRKQREIPQMLTLDGRSKHASTLRHHSRKKKENHRVKRSEFFEFHRGDVGDLKRVFSA